MRFCGLLLPVLLITLVVSSCREEHKVGIDAGIKSKGIPTMVTTDVSTLISDSGITQYKIVSPVWYVYDEVDTPYWNFPKGLYLTKFDPMFRTIASVACDSARYLKHSMIWKLDGNVELHSAPSDIFLTEQLFWNQRTHTIYSDSFIHIENANRIIEGYGFHSNEKLTEYRIIRPTGIFPVNRERLTQGADSGRASAVPASHPVSVYGN